MSGIRHAVRQECVEHIAGYRDPGCNDPSQFWGRIIREVLGGPGTEGGEIESVSSEQFSERQYNRLVNAGQEIYELAETWRRKYPETPEPRSDGWAALLALTETVGVPPRRRRGGLQADEDEALLVTYLAVITWLINVEGGLASTTFSLFPQMISVPPEPE